MMADAAIEFRPNSRLVMIRSGMNWSERLQKNLPDTSWFVWEGRSFRRILFVAGKQPEQNAAH
jgi:hypothetical protein